MALVPCSLPGFESGCMLSQIHIVLSSSTVAIFLLLRVPICGQTCISEHVQCSLLLTVPYVQASAKSYPATYTLQYNSQASSGTQPRTAGRTVTACWIR